MVGKANLRVSSDQFLKFQIFEIFEIFFDDDVIISTEYLRSSLNFKFSAFSKFRGDFLQSDTHTMFVVRAGDR
jgi:hypothetical protein